MIIIDSKRLNHEETYAMKIGSILKVLVLIVLAQPVFAIDVIDGNNPKYISSVESLAKVVQLLNMAETEMLKVYNLNSLPGYMASSELGRLGEIKARANYILQPEKRRLISKPLIIDGFYNTKNLNELTKEKEKK